MMINISFLYHIIGGEKLAGRLMCGVVRRDGIRITMRDRHPSLSKQVGRLALVAATESCRILSATALSKWRYLDQQRVLLKPNISVNRDILFGAYLPRFFT